MINLKKTNKFEIGKSLVPEKIYRLKYRQELEKVYQKLYFNNVNYIVITNMFFLSILVSLTLYLFSYNYLLEVISPFITKGGIYKYFTLFLTFFIYNVIMYYIMLLSYFLYNDSKFKKIEEDIERDVPDFIDNLVSNLKGGISLEKALLKSVRKDQKALLQEVTLINEKILMGKDVNTALSEFRKRFTSPVINRTFFLIEEGLRGGGNLAAPLERISVNLKKIYELDEEIKSNSGGFAVVIRAITLVVAPALFALALTLLIFIGNLFDLLSDAGSTLTFATTLPDAFVDYLKVFSYSMLVLITIFSSLITSHLKNEKAYAALKYLPIYITIVVFLYIFMSDILIGYFGNII